VAEGEVVGVGAGAVVDTVAVGAGAVVGAVLVGVAVAQTVCVGPGTKTVEVAVAVAVTVLVTWTVAVGHLLQGWPAIAVLGANRPPATASTVATTAVTPVSAVKVARLLARCSPPRWRATRRATWRPELLAMLVLLGARAGELLAVAPEWDPEYIRTSTAVGQRRVNRRAAGG
jgi:hypothetical protein